MLKKGTRDRRRPRSRRWRPPASREIVVARLEPGDVSEDEAAAEIAAAVAGEGVRVDRAFTGRCQSVRRAGRRAGGRQGRASTALNRVDEAITFATLPAFKPVVAGEMIATVKIIPFAVGDAARDAALAVARAQAAGPRRALPDQARSAWSRRCCRGSPTRWSRRRCKVTQERLAPAGATIVAERRVPHEQAALAKAHRGGAQGRRRAGGRVRRLRHRRPARRDPGRDRGGRRRASSISACRSIPAT